MFHIFWQDVFKFVLLEYTGKSSFTFVISIIRFGFLDHYSVVICRMYPAMETLIEPHRLIACMNCIVSVVRPMLSSGKWYPEGKLHILPLLNLALPGIDSNDFKKCLVIYSVCLSHKMYQCL